MTYTYDGNGNQTGRGSDTFTWDHENRLTSSTVGGVTTTYTYNGDGLRMNKTTGGVTTSYTWDVARRVPMCIQETTGSTTTSFVYGRGLIATVDASGDHTYRFTDGIGSTVHLMDDSGGLLVTYRYDAFGGIRSQSFAHENYWLFAGEQRDSETGYDYLRARYYDSETGRFISVDPVTADRYGYARNNPVRLTDPLGLYAICGWDPIWQDYCFDSTEVGLPADPPIWCDDFINYCVWADGTIAHLYDTSGRWPTWSANCGVAETCIEALIELRRICEAVGCTREQAPPWVFMAGRLLKLIEHPLCAGGGPGCDGFCYPEFGFCETTYRPTYEVICRESQYFGPECYTVGW